MTSERRKSLPAKLWRRLFRFVRQDVPADVDNELEFHLAMRAERNRALGVDDANARAFAEKRFGDVATVRAELIAHDQRREIAVRRTEYFADLLQDIRFAARGLRRAPAFAFAAVATLALGIGANSAIFSVINAVVLRPLPYSSPERLVSIGSGSAGEYAALVERLHSFESVAAWVSNSHPVDDGVSVTRRDGVAFTANMLPMLGVSPARGRGFTESDALKGGETVVIVSDPFAQRIGGGKDVLDRFITIEGVRCRIVGVMPPDFRYPAARVEYWLPYRADPTNLGYTWAVQDKKFVARLKHAVSLQTAASDVAATWPTMRKLNPLWDAGDQYGKSTQVTPLQDRVLGAARGYIWMLFGAVVLVLIIASVNVANLLLARATARAREFSVRAALGGHRGRLVRQLLTESALLSAFAAVLGAGVGWAALRWLVASLPAEVPRVHEIGFDGVVMAYTMVVSLVTGVVLGIVPALRATSPLKANPSAGFGRGLTTGVSHTRVASFLVGGEVALAVLLVAASALLLRSFSALTNVEPGFDPEHVVAALVTVPETQYRDPARVAQLYESVMERTAALPGVQHVAAVDRLPMAQPVWGIGVRVEGQYEDGRHVLPDIQHFQSITPEYFAAMGVPVQQGRSFEAADREGTLPVAIISEGVAKKFWPGQDPIGKRIGYPFPSPWMTIVGVVPDTKQDSLSEARSMSFYAPYRQRTRMSGGEMWVVVRATGDAAQLGPALRKIVHDEDPNVAIGDLRTMRNVLAATLGTTRFITTLVTAFGALALLLGAVGIYGVMSYTVNERMREMGIRLALGATRTDVVRLIVVRAVVLAVIGVAVGIGTLLLAWRALAPWLFGVPQGDWIATVAVPLTFVIVAVVASLVPALRGARGDVSMVMRAG